jgi:hypothetical protein
VQKKEYGSSGEIGTRFDSQGCHLANGFVAPDDFNESAHRSYVPQNYSAHFPKKMSEAEQAFCGKSFPFEPQAIKTRETLWSDY